MMYTLSCPFLSRTPYLVSVALLLGRKEKKHGMQPLCVYFAPYGGREIEEPLRTLN